VFEYSVPLLFQMQQVTPVANTQKGTALFLLPELTTSPLRICSINTGGGRPLRSIKNDQMLFVFLLFWKEQNCSHISHFLLNTKGICMLRYKGASKIGRFN